MVGRGDQALAKPQIMFCGIVSTRHMDCLYGGLATSSHRSDGMGIPSLDMSCMH